MTDLASPPAVRLPRARWLDLRVVGGVLLLLASVVGVGVVVSSADDTTAMWVATRPLAAGATVTSDDLAVAHVHLGDTTGTHAYLPSTTTVAGSVVVRAIGAGELVPAKALAPPESAPPRRLVTVAVERFHLPTDLGAGDVVDVYAVPDAMNGTGSALGASGQPRLVLANAVVSSVDDSGSRFGGTAEVGVALAVAPSDVPGIVAATGRGSLTLVGVPPASGLTPTSTRS